MRQIKFRVWDSVDKTMYYPLDISYRYAIQLTGQCNLFKADGGVEHCKDILLQYTGLKDKNGVDIYEGDIFEYGYVVTYVDGSDNANLGMDVGFYSQRDNFESWGMLVVGEEYEVIGNIYENADLIKR